MKTPVFAAYKLINKRTQMKPIANYKLFPQKIQYVQAVSSLQ